jgi:hypothetical protein
VFGLGPATRIYLAAGVTDMRKGFEGLYGPVSARLFGRGAPWVCRSPDPAPPRPYSRCVGSPAYIDSNDRVVSTKAMSRQLVENAILALYGRGYAGAKDFPSKFRHCGFSFEIICCFPQDVLGFTVHTISDSGLFGL